MKRSVICIIILSLLTMTACGGKKGPDPISPVELGSTLAQAQAADPTLTEYSKDEYSISIQKDLSYAGAVGVLQISFRSFEGEPTVRNIHWDCEPADGNGKAVYDQLFTALKECYGKPKESRDKQNVSEGVALEHNEASGQWVFDDYTVSCSYYEIIGGVCQIHYRRDVKTDPFTFE